MSEHVLPIDQVIHGEALEVLKSFPSNCLDAAVLDPPAGIDFMQKKFDSNRGGRDNWIAWLAQIMREVYRVLKPGSHAFVWSLPRTSHWTGMALEYAGFELRDCCYHLYAQDAQVQVFLDSLTQNQQDALGRILANQEDSMFLHLFGSGFPKSHNLSKAIDRYFKIEREVVGMKAWTNPKMEAGHGVSGLKWAGSYAGEYEGERVQATITAPATPESKTWDGWGSALKPAVEAWWLVRKPLSEKGIAQNVLKWGTGAINIDGARIGYANKQDAEPKNYSSSKGIGTYQEWSKDQGARQYADGLSYTKNDFVAQTHPQGRWPSHLLMSHSLWCTEDTCSESCPVWLLDQQSGTRKSGKEGINGHKRNHSLHDTSHGWGMRHSENAGALYGDQGGASRYFAQFTPDAPFLYTSKASRAERNRGCEDLPARKGFDKNSSKQIAHINHNTGETTYNEYQPSANQNSHPTVKNLALMRYLCRMVCPKGGIVLDPFGGSGSTALGCIEEGMHFILVEEQDTEEEPYVSIARARIAHALEKKRGKA